MKEIADDSFKLDENGRVLQKGRKHGVKGRNCSLQAISSFPTVFSKGLHSRHIKNLGLFGKGLNMISVISLKQLTSFMSDQFD